jgi:hypothetical protein
MTNRSPWAWRRPSHCVLFVLAVLTMAAPAAASSALAARLRGHPGTQAAVLELARAGAPEAMLLLCRHHGPASAGMRDSGRYWCARAAENGSVPALRDLGLALVLETDGSALHREGLTLLALAELVRDREAAASLAVLPDFAPVRTADVSAARDEALARIEGANWLDARRLGVRLELGDAERRRSESAKARLRERAALVSRDDPASRARQLRARRLEGRATLGITASERTAYRARLAEDDRRQRLIIQRDAKTKKAALSATGEERARLDRAARRRRGAELRAGVVAPEVRQSLIARLAPLLESINQHRSAEHALRLEDLGLDWVAKGGE